MTDGTFPTFFQRLFSPLLSHKCVYDSVNGVQRDTVLRHGAYGLERVTTATWLACKCGRAKPFDTREGGMDLNRVVRDL
jgi:hypothetical protein